MKWLAYIGFCIILLSSVYGYNLNHFVLYYNFTRAANSSTGKWNAVNTGVTFQSGKYGLGGNFSAATDRYAINTSANNINSNIGFGCWVYNSYTGSADTNRIWYENADVALKISGNEATGTIVPAAWNWNDGNVAINTTQWTHLYIQFNDTANQLEFYRNTVRVANFTASGARSSASNVFQLGNGDSNTGFNGLLDECFIYNGTLNSADLKTISGATYPFVEPTPDYSVTLNWNLVNNSNHTNLYLPIYFNGTLGEDVSNTTFVCDLKVNETINSTAAYDLEDNNLINFSVGTRYGYLNFLLNCTNSYGNDTIGFYKLFFNTSYSQAATTTTTVNLTAVESLLEEINEGNNMISIMILYIGLLALGFWLIRNGNFISGVLTLGMSIILDFVIIAGLYNIYQPKVIDATGSYLAYLQIFLITFGSLWLALKIGLVLLVKGKRFKY